jgi:PTH2 family peptidyl-tRNA hydrolase
MPALALVFIDSLLKVAGGIAIGWLIRDASAKKAPGNSGGSQKAGKAANRRAGAAAAASAKPAPVPRPKEELKMVLCVNMSLKMGTGKVGAQCAHAAVGVLWSHYQSHNVAIRQWEMYGQPKIALKVRLVRLVNRRRRGCGA